MDTGTDAMRKRCWGWGPFSPHYCTPFLCAPLYVHVFLTFSLSVCLYFSLFSSSSRVQLYFSLSVSMAFSVHFLRHRLCQAPQRSCLLLTPIPSSSSSVEQSLPLSPHPILSWTGSSRVLRKGIYGLAPWLHEQARKRTQALTLLTCAPCRWAM